MIFTSTAWAATSASAGLRTEYSVLSTPYVRQLAFACLLATSLHSRASAEEPPFHLGHRAANDLPTLTADELNSPRQQALLAALAGDAYAHRAADHERAGCAMLVRRQAIPSNTRYYGGYWVGGGVPLLGEGPTLEEGTFGWDYFGMTFSKRVDLNWTHGRRHQGGFGHYKTDGPRLHHR
jgi:hypothetical protein